jgi:ABC-2 type transport system ATP-binding protein
MTSAVQVQEVSRRFRRRAALRSVTATFPLGSVTALVGSNGAGKTTLLNLVVGLLTPTTGTISLFGHMAPGSLEALAKVAYVAQDGPVSTSRSVGDAVRIARAFNSSFDYGTAVLRLQRLGIDLRQRVSKLSGGQRSQLAITLALARAPELLVLDEPLSSLDPIARRDLLGELMGYCADIGMTIIFSSHVIVELEKIASHLVLIKDGEAVVAGQIDDLLQRHRNFVGTSAEAVLAHGEYGTVISQSHPLTLASRVIRFDDVPVSNAMLTPATLEDLAYAYLEHTPPGSGEPSK